jgi:hypothetical protein
VLRMPLPRSMPANHPPETMLRRFAWSRASQAEVRRIVAHLLRRCRKCSEIVLSELPGRPSVSSRQEDTR